MKCVWLAKVFIAALICLVWMGCASEMKRGSNRSLYTIADTLEVHASDIGKSIQLNRDQKLLFDFEKDDSQPGVWELVDYDRRKLLLLSDTPRMPSGHYGFLLQARVMGSGEVNLRFSPLEETQPSRDVTFEFSISR
jgi:hypothetical protein